MFHHLESGFSVGGEELRFTYNTYFQLVNQAGGLYSPPLSLGKLWSTNFHKSLQINTASVVAHRGSGEVVDFLISGTTYTPATGVSDKLSLTSGVYYYRDTQKNALELYDSSGNLTSIQYANGATLTFGYGAGYLTSVTDNTGRSISFTYQVPSGAPVGSAALIHGITDSSGRSISAGYDANGNLTLLTWPDTKTTQLQYSNTALPWALTGLIDELGVTQISWDYSAGGHATSSQLAGNVEHYSLTPQTTLALHCTKDADTVNQRWVRNCIWTTPGLTDMGLPNGGTNTVSTVMVNGYPASSGQSQPAGSGCAASTSAQTYDSHGNVASYDDFSGNRTCYAYDLSRDLQTVRVEGLATTQDCASVLSAGATLPTGARKTTTTWHPTWRLPVQVDEPGKRTTYIYNGQPDPFTGVAQASCAPTTAKTADGQPIAVLCKKVEQATLDANGQGQTNIDPYYANVSLLLHADGANNSTVITDSSPSPSVFTSAGTAVVSASKSKFGSASIYLPGNSTGYASAPSKPGFQMGSGDFTIESWVYPTTWTPAAVGYNTMFCVWTSTREFVFRIFEGQVKFLPTSNGTGGDMTTASSAPGAVPLNAWSHIAVVRNANIYTIYVNGSSTGGTPMTSALGLSAATSNLYIGICPEAGPASLFAGYIDEVRITKGVARYTGNFTPPTQSFAPDPLALLDSTVANVVTQYSYDTAGRMLSMTDPRGYTSTYAYYSDTTSFAVAGDSGDPYYNAVSLLLHGDGAEGSTAITDSSASPKTVTPSGTAKISTAQSKFGGAALSLTGGAYASSPNNAAFQLGAGDFTLEMWVYPTAWSATYNTLLGVWNSGNVSYILLGSAGRLQFIPTSNNTGSDMPAALSAANAVPLNAWSHVAVVRQGSVFTIYVNGSSAGGTVATSTAALYPASTNLYIGINPAGGVNYAHVGYIDELRITKGVARYTGNFAVPTQAFSNALPVLDPNAVGHRAGDLMSVTNAAGHVTQYTQYDGAGRVRQSVDPKGVVTDITYTARGKPSTITVTAPGGTARLTQYGYDLAGQLKTVQNPDGTSLSYNYDAAHRLVGITDAAGNSVSYTLDNAGNKTAENYSDPGGNLKRSISRSIDALNRVQQVTGAAQ